MVTSIQVSGIMLGAVLFAQLSDLIGRKKSYYAAHFLICAPGVASGLANSWQVSVSVSVSASVSASVSVSVGASASVS